MEDLVKTCLSWSELYRKYYNTNQPNNRTLKKFKEQYSYLDTSHFTKNPKKYRDVETICPVCGKTFITKSGGSKVSVTCSHSCANTHFRTGINHGNWKSSNYRSTCFFYHKKCCVVCKEDKIVEVHHFDGDSKNNSPENLIPLCPTHHQYWHSRFKHLIETTIVTYRLNFIKTNIK